MKRLVPLLALLLAFGGCASVNLCSVGGRTMADIENTGWYLFNFIPLASGNPERPNANSCKLFQETTTLESNMRLLDYAMRKDGGYTGYRNLVSYTTDENILLILFKRRACHTSAELFKETPNP